MKKTEEIKKLRSLDKKALKAELLKQKNEHVLVSLKVGAGKEDNFSQIKKLRKNIARINTILSEQMSGEENE